METKPLLTAKKIHTVRYGTEAVTHICTKTWNIQLNDCKTSAVTECKIKVKKWISKNCPYRLCKNYVLVGFV